MDNAAKRSCSASGSGDYRFWSRRQIVRKPGKEGPDQIETKFRCKSCGEDGRVRTEGRLLERKPEE
jgi:hypothetical protein